MAPAEDRKTIRITRPQPTNQPTNHQISRDNSGTAPNLTSVHSRTRSRSPSRPKSFGCRQARSLWPDHSQIVVRAQCRLADARWSKGKIRASGAREPSSTLGRATSFSPPCLFDFRSSPVLPSSVQAKAARVSPRWHPLTHHSWLITHDSGVFVPCAAASNPLLQRLGNPNPNLNPNLNLNLPHRRARSADWLQIHPSVVDVVDIVVEDAAPVRSGRSIPRFLRPPLHRSAPPDPSFGLIAGSSGSNSLPYALTYGVSLAHMRPTPRSANCQSFVRSSARSTPGGGRPFLVPRENRGKGMVSRHDAHDRHQALSCLVSSWPNRRGARILILIHFRGPCFGWESGRRIYLFKCAQLPPKHALDWIRET